MNVISKYVGTSEPENNYSFFFVFLFHCISYGTLILYSDSMYKDWTFNQWLCVLKLQWKWR